MHDKKLADGHSAIEGGYVQRSCAGGGEGMHVGTTFEQQQHRVQ